MKSYYKRNVKFVRIACKHCGFDQILFTRSSTKVRCFNCRASLTVPKGGKCKIIDATITENLE